jgi:hypothetical protein
MHTDLNRRELRELDQRSAEGLEVTLLWSARTGSVFVCVEDKTASDGFHFAVEPADAMEAFRHPYGYSRRGLRRHHTRSLAGRNAGHV